MKIGDSFSFLLYSAAPFHKDYPCKTYYQSTDDRSVAVWCLWENWPWWSSRNTHKSPKLSFLKFGSSWQCDSCLDGTTGCVYRHTVSPHLIRSYYQAGNVKIESSPFWRVSNILGISWSSFEHFHKGYPYKTYWKSTENKFVVVACLWEIGPWWIARKQCKWPPN